jgi:hypothetical protein
MNLDEIKKKEDSRWLTDVLYRNLPVEAGETMKNSARIYCVLAEIRTEHPP